MPKSIATQAWSIGHMNSEYEPNILCILQVAVGSSSQEACAGDGVDAVGKLKLHRYSVPESTPYGGPALSGQNAKLSNLRTYHRLSSRIIMRALSRATNLLFLPSFMLSDWVRQGMNSWMIQGDPGTTSYCHLAFWKIRVTEG